MGRSKTVMLDRMRRRISEMKPFIKMSKSKEGVLDFPDDSIHVPASLMREGYSWLMTIVDGPFYAVRKVWALCPKEVWDRYFLFGGFDDHREMIMLKTALKEFRKQIMTRNRPGFFKKGKRNGIIKKALATLKGKGK